MCLWGLQRPKGIKKGRKDHRLTSTPCLCDLGQVFDLSEPRAFILYL